MNRCTSIKNASKRSFQLKVVIVMLAGFGVRLFFSCVPPPPMDLYYNSVYVTGVDNSDRYIMQYEMVDTMYADAVALNLTIRDTSFYYIASTFNMLTTSFSFLPAMAFSYDESFTPVNKLEHIGVTTLLDLNSSIKAGDDITDYILYDTGSDSGLYSRMNEAIATFNRTQSSTESSVVMVLSKSVENTKAQFRVQVSLNDGSQLSYVTDTLAIISVK